MDPETKGLLRQNIELAKQNNELLQKLVRAQKMMTIYRVVYWSIIILSSLGAYYFIQPYLSGMLNIYTGGDVSQDGTSSSDISNAFKTLSNKQQMQDLVNALNEKE